MNFDPIIELTLGGYQVDITHDVTGRGDGFRIARGQPNEASAAAPSSCQFELNNQAGKYSPRNPLGPYYGKLVRNTPVRVCTRELVDEYDRTVVNGWGDSPTGGPWQVGGVGGTVADSDWQAASGRGTVSIPALGAYRRATLMDGQYRDIDVSALFRMETLLPTAGSKFVEAGLTFRVVDELNYYSFVAYASANNGSFSLSLRREGFAPVVLASAAGQGVWWQGYYLFLRVQVEGRMIKARAAVSDYQGAIQEPERWNLTATDSTYTAGGVGVHTGVNDSLTIQLPTVIAVHRFEVRSPRFSGELASLPPRWDVTGRAAWVPVEASGITRRLARNDVPIKTAVHRYNTYRLVKTTPIYYWSLEEPAEVARGYEALGRTAPFRTIAGAAKFGEGQLNKPWLTNVLSVSAGDQVVASQCFFAAPPSNSYFSMHFARAGGAGTKDQIGFYDGAGLLLTGLWFDGTTNRCGFFTRAAVGDGGLNMVKPLDGDVHHIRLNIFPSAVNGNFSVYIDGAYEESFGLGVWSLQDVYGVAISGRAGSTAPTAYGHVSIANAQALSTDDTIHYRALMGWQGEPAGVRIQRLCDEGYDAVSDLDAVALDARGDLTKTTKMGPQGIGSFLGTLQECANVDHGSLVESRSTFGLTYISSQARYNQSSILALDYGNKELTPPWELTEDDQLTVNDAIATRVDGGSSRYERSTGPLSVAAIGRYRKEETLNVYSDLQLPSLASWMVHVGTVDEPRFPRIAVNRARPQLRSNPALSRQILAANIGDRLTISNINDLSIYGTISQAILGYEERVDQYQHSFVFNCAPDSPYQVIRLNHSTEGRVESANTTLAIAATTSTTELIIDVGGSPGSPGDTNAALWTTNPTGLPIPITINGEDMLVTAIANQGTGRNMSFVGVGAAAHAVHPGGTSQFQLLCPLPSGLITGDLLVMFGGFRDNTTNAEVRAYLPWKQLGTSALAGNMNVFALIYSSSLPSSTFQAYFRNSPGGAAANSDCSLQMAAFRGFSTACIGAMVTATASSQNIAVDYADLRPASSDLLWLVAGWKQNAWTSVTSTVGGTQLGAFTSTAGNDQSMVWEYLIASNMRPPLQTLGPSQFTVTGGAVAPNAGRMFAFVPRIQRMTVQRGVNGIRKNHAVGSAIRFTRPATLAL